MPAILILLVVLVLAIIGVARWMSNRHGEEGKVHDHPIDRDSAV